MKRVLHVGIVCGGVVMAGILGTADSVLFAQPPCLENELLASDGESEDRFGLSVGISGDVAVVGAPRDQENGFLSGSAYLFRYDPLGRTWVEEAKLLPSDGVHGDEYGSAVAIDGEVAVVGSYRHEDHGIDGGAAYIYRYDGSEWNEEAKLLASDAAAGAWLGLSVSLCAEVLLVGAEHDDDYGDKSGSAYIFRYDGMQWVEEAKLLASDGAAGDRFGISVALDGDVAVIGSWKDDDNGEDSGSAYVYRFDGTTWVEEAKLLPPDGASQDFFGSSIGVSGDVAVVGANNDADNGPFAGSAYVYRFDGTDWDEVTKLLASDGEASDGFGRSAAVCDELVIVGAKNDDENGGNSGAVYTYRFDGTNWIEGEKTMAPGGEMGDHLGVSVAIAGDVFIAGAIGHHGNESETGAAFVFACSPSDCEGDANGDGHIDPLDFGYV